MKLLEVCILLVTIIIMYGYIFGLLKRTKMLFLFYVLGAAIFIIHAAVEGFRLQMYPLYALFAICFLSLFIPAIRQKKMEESSKSSVWKKAIIGVMSTAMLAVALFKPLYALPIIKIPEPTGPHAIGVDNYHWIDLDRAEQFTADPSDTREIMIRAWYPAEMIKGAKKAHYAHETKQLIQASSNLPMEYRILLSSISQAENHSYTNVPLADQPQEFPVLILSPGYGLNNFMYTSQAENLASHGYIVLSIEHTYYMGLPTIFPDGRFSEGQVDLEDVDADEEINIWVEDVEFALHKLKELNENDPNGMMTGRIDINRIGMLGHSLGGATTAQVMHQNPLIIAGVNMDGYHFGTLIEDGLTNPYMYMTASPEILVTSVDGEEVTDLPDELAEFVAEDKKRTEGVLSNNGKLLLMPDAEHDSYSDWMLYSPLLFQRDLPLLNKINQSLLDFFDEHVKNVLA